MTVADLIARLGAFDPALRVVMPAEDRGFCEVEGVFGDIVWFDGKTAQLSDERTPEANEAVVRLFGPDED